MQYVRILICSSSLSVIIFSAASSGESRTMTALLSRGDSLYSLNDYGGSASSYRDAAMDDSSNFDAYWKLGRSLNLVGEMAPRDSQLAVFEEARDAEKRAVELDSQSADAHFQQARALGKIALFKGVFKSIGLAKQVKREAEEALALDSLHDGAWHILGRWNREIARKPKIFRGPLGLGAANQKDAVAFMQKAISLNPNLIHHHLEMGVTYREYGRKEQAREEFQKCLSLAAGGPVDDKYKEEAENYLAEMDKK